MLRQVYLGIGSVLLVGYLGWSVLGMEWATRRDPVPTEPRYRSSGSRGSSRGFFSPSSGFGK